MTKERPRVSRDVIDAFSKIDTACIGDVLGGLGLRGITLGIHPLHPKMRICGQAVTMRQITSRDRRNWARHEQVLVEMCQPGDILVIDMGGRLDGAPWGANVTQEAINRKLGGTLIDGASRDRDEIIEMGYPVFSQGVTLRHTHGYYYSTCLNDYPVQIGQAPMQIMVAPGDIVVGDNDGVVVVPGDKAQEILAIAQRRHALDLEMGNLMKSGKGHGDKEIIDLLVEVRRLEGVEQAEGYKW